MEIAPQQPFLDAIAEFVGQPPGKIGCYVIHLKRATEREANMKALREALGGGVETLNAQEGATLVAEGHPTGCVFDPAKPRTPGEVGCLMSHAVAARLGSLMQQTHFVIFEDDCVPSEGYNTEALKAYLADVSRLAAEFKVRGTRDFLLLSSGGTYDVKPLTPRVKACTKFNGSHALLMSAEFAKRFIGSYEHTTKKKLCIPVDALYGFVAKVSRQPVLCPAGDTELFKQNRETGSYTLDTEGKTIRTG
jgi:GR25 family glycosyltransferase involved in LPS biosynthesis